jgi:hypothetical protein
MYTSFYEQVFYEVPQESTRTPFKRWKRCSPTSWKARVFNALSRRSYKICYQRFFSYKSFCARKKKKLVPTSYLQEEYLDSPSSFLSYNLLNSRKAKDFYAMSYVQGQRSMCPKPRIPFFWFTSIGVQGNPSWLKYWLLRDLLYEEAMCKDCTGNGLLNAAKAVP